MLSVYALEHSQYEKPVYICEWLNLQRIECNSIKIFEGAGFPDPGIIDLLLIMGGPMNIYEENQYPWLIPEKLFIKTIIEEKIPVLGICLGGQLIADILGGQVIKADLPEHGWHTIRRVKNSIPLIHSADEDLFLPETITVFQWNQDTFSIPAGAIHLYTSERCINQAFLYDDRVIALQFHPELDPESINAFLNSFRDSELNPNMCFLIDEIRSKMDFYSQGQEFVAMLLEYLVTIAKEKRAKI